MIETNPSSRSMPTSFVEPSLHDDNDDGDSRSAEAFAGRMLDVLNGGFLSVMVSIGHQTQLFDVLATLPSSTSHEVARAAALHERYVREWLGAMVTGGIVDYDPSEGTYFLPRHRAACLTRAAGSDNLASLSQFVSLIGEVEGPMVEVFHRGGGLPYSAFPRFHALMAEESRAVFESTLLSRTLPLISGLPSALESGIDVADIGCGQGDALLLLAQRFPMSRFVGIDLSPQAIARARDAATERTLSNLDFRVQDAASFVGEPTFDLITAFDAIHDQAQPRRVLSAIRKRLKPTGVFLMVDIHVSSRLECNLAHPFAPFLYTISTLHCTPVSLAEGGEGLGACWGEEKARELLAEAGFSSVEVRRVEGDMVNAYFICRP